MSILDNVAEGIRLARVEQDLDRLRALARALCERLREEGRGIPFVMWADELAALERELEKP